MMEQTYRSNGAIGALLDEYERALRDLKNTIAPLSSNQLITVADHQTTDEDCRSIQTILAHVVRSGYAYAVYIRNQQGENLAVPERQLLDSIAAYQTALDQMFFFNIQTFADYPNLPVETKEQALKIRTNWGQFYDVEQLMEHAIVHILRHRRQIERML
jgi:uncharacterized damage-inducible protein DinB